MTTEGEVEAAEGLPGDPDGLQRLWTPHRMAYITGEDAASREGPSGCPLCRAGLAEDGDALVVGRAETTFVLLNIYPYNSGHLMVLPYRHVADYLDLTDAETAELAEMTKTALRVLHEVMHPQGFNLGINQGAVAGAGIAGHIHQHVVPRWGGDSNFLPIVGQTKALPELLGRTRDRLAAAWPSARG